MQVAQNAKQILSILLIIVLVIGLLSAFTVGARAAEILPQELYIEQSRSGVCTLASATMLVRSTLYLNGSTQWEAVTESDMSSVAWIYGVGLRYEWTFQTDDATITVEHTDLQGITSEALKALLDEHPEGIVFYCGYVPHAVFLTDYEGDVFYTADPAPYCSGSRIPLADSWLGRRCGPDQADILASATAYWSVTECSVTADMDEIPLDALGLRESDPAAITEAKELLLMESSKILSRMTMISV